MIELPVYLFEEVFGLLCKEYKLRIVPVNLYEVLLVSASFSIYFFTEPHENSIFIYYVNYIDSPGNKLGIDVYAALELFLDSKRYIPLPERIPASSSEEEKTRFALKRFCNHLIQKGQDILKGEKDWIKDYPWESSMAISHEIIDIILREWKRDKAEKLKASNG